MSENDSSGTDVHRAYLRRIVACFLVLLAAWGAGDVLMALASKQAPALVTPVEFVEGLGMAMRRGFQYESTYVNSAGFRRTELPPVVPGEIRILALGDSVTFGTNLANEEDWPAALEKELRARGVPATVMNAGNPGVQSSYMFGALKYYAARMKVDLVLVHNTGNMLAIYSMDKGLKPFEIGDRLFPDHRRGSLRTRPQCPDTSIVRAPANEAVSLPAIIKRLTAHSPAIAEILSKLKDRSARPAPSVQSIPEDCFSPPAPAEYMARDMLAMGQMIEYADRERLPLVFLRPTYVFNFASPEERRKGPPTFLAYTGSWGAVENVERMFDFFEQSRRARLVDPVSRVREAHATQQEASRLYLDYTHFSAEGARLVSRAIADELLQKGLVAPTTNGPWLHPAESRQGTRDLRYRDIPGSLSVGGVVAAGVFVSLVTFIVGLAVQMALPGFAQRPFGAASMFGFFVAAALGLVANNYSADAYRPWLGIAGVAAAALVALAVRRRFPVRQAALTALGGAALSAASAAVILAFLHHGVWKDPRHLRYIGIEVAWAEYLIPEKDRVLQLDVARRQLADGTARPHMVPNIVSAHSQVVQPASPSMAVYTTRLAGLRVQDAVIGVWAAFCGAIAMLALGAAWALRRRLLAAALAAIAGLAVFLPATVVLPTPLTMALAAALSVAFLAMCRRDAHSDVRWGLLFVAGAIAYVLPARMFLAAVALLVVLAGLRAGWVSRSLRGGAKEGLIALVVVLAARALLFDTTVVDERLYRLLGVNNLEFVPFFL